MQLTAEPQKRMKSRSSERKDGSEWNDPGVVEKYQRLEEQPRYVDVASGIDELELLSAQRKNRLLSGMDTFFQQQIYRNLYYTEF